ncbi:MAG: potassium transporter TrkG [Candidatus Faecousia sp.]|nr:TrkH family potassium uptake protein [Clostridiales bacterium]MDD7651367.1 potassium transporter TrkG [Bacillota bacterium]MDY4219467.1 potassium transporter TrkG [Candidatus Faecousia sp.]
MAKLKNCSNCGKLALLISALVAAPLLSLPFFPGEGRYWLSFAAPALASSLFGGLLCRFGRGAAGESDRQEALKRSSLTVLFAWLWGIGWGAVPFVLSGQLTFLQALFESVSGWTTTGLSVMDVTKTPGVFLLYRSFMQYCGGLGFVMMMVMLIPNKQAMDLYSAEGHPDKLTPNLKKTAQLIFAMYTAFLAVGTAAYALLGMPILDSVCHAMCALSTGGFSTRLNSIGEYHSLPIEAVTMALMLIGTTNFAVLLLLVRGRLRQASQVSETRFLFLLLLIFIPVTGLSLAGGLHMGPGEALRHGAFNVVSALSTTGYATMSYAQWPPLALGILILMMLVGGGMGSTAGGLKLTRVYLLLRIMGLNIKRRLRSQRSVEAPSYTKAQGKTRIDEALCWDTVGFTGCYLLLFLAGSLLLTLTADCGLTEAMFEFASALGTVGLSIGLTGPATGAATMLVEICGMLLGRLEIFIVLIGCCSGLQTLKSALKRHPGRSC